MFLRWRAPGDGRKGGGGGVIVSGIVSAVCDGKQIKVASSLENDPNRMRPFRFRPFLPWIQGRPSFLPRHHLPPIIPPSSLLSALASRPLCSTTHPPSCSPLTISSPSSHTSARRQTSSGSMRSTAHLPIPYHLNRPPATAMITTVNKERSDAWKATGTISTSELLTVQWNGGCAKDQRILRLVIP